MQQRARLSGAGATAMQADSPVRRDRSGRPGSCQCVWRQGMFLAGLFVWQVVSTATASFVDVGERSQMFFDDALLDPAATSAVRQVHSIDGGDDPMIILRPEEPWELGKTLDHASVLYDPTDQKIKLYYSIATNCGVTCDQKTDEEDGMLGYAESTDGLHFHKPKLGLINDTNLLGPNVAGPSVFLNAHPNATSDERFVSVGKCHAAAPMCPNAWAWMTSADGVHWPNIHNPATCGMKKSVDTQYTTFFDPATSTFLSYTRDRYGEAPEVRAIRRVRRVSAQTLGIPGKSYTDAECPWTNSTVVIDIDERDNMTHPRAANTDSYNKIFPPMDLYGAVVWPDFSAGVYWALPWRFWHFERGGGPGTYDVALMSSRDGLHFKYVDDRRSFVRTGREGTAGSARVRVLPSPIVVNDTMLVYLYLTNLAEKKASGGYNATTDNRPIESALGVVRMRKDGFVALASPTYGQEAVITTISLVASAGGDLWVNADCLNGELRVELRAADSGKTLPGFSLNASIPLSVNSVKARVQWQADNTVQVGAKLVIVFHLLEARLYSFQFQKRD